MNINLMKQHLWVGVLGCGACLWGAGVQAQANCGEGASAGESVSCTSTGVAQTAPITIFAAQDGHTELLVNTRRGVRDGAPSTIPVLLQGSGAGQITVDLQAHMRAGTINFAANSGGATFRVAGYALDYDAPGGWAMNGSNRFGSGDDRLQNLGNSVLTASIPESGWSSRDRSALVQTTLDFGAGVDRLENEGFLVIGESRAYRDLLGVDRDLIQTTGSDSRHPQGHQFTATNLETLQNSGQIMMGGWIEGRTWRPFPELYGSVCQFNSTYPASDKIDCVEFYEDTDRVTASVLSLPGTRFVGDPGSSLLLDARFDRGVSQADCQQRSLRQGIQQLPGADCMEIIGGETEGITEVIVRDGLPGSLGSASPDGILIVDVSGGQSAAAHFVLSAESDDFDAETGTLDKGMFMFGLAFDEARQQHRLVSAPSPRAHRLPLLVQATQTVSRSTGGQWFDRRADLRLGGADALGGAWVRLRQDSGSRDAEQRASMAGGTVSFDNSYDLDTTVFSVGRDVRLGEAWVLGGSFHYVDATVEFDRAAAAAEFGGAALGVHAGYETTAGLYFDSQAMMQWLEMDYLDAYFPTPLDDTLHTLDLRAELGWRLNLSPRLFVEPMLGASWVRSEFEAMTLLAPRDPTGRPENSVFGDGASSLRATAGARLYASQSLSGVQLGYGLTARYWHSLQDDTKVPIDNMGPTDVVQDTFDSGLIEVGAGVDLRNTAGNLGASLQATGFFGDYESLGLTAGLRFQW
jgi:outer membrane autotransporter protein